LYYCCCFINRNFITIEASSITDSIYFLLSREDENTHQTCWDKAEKNILLETIFQQNFLSFSKRIFMFFVGFKIMLRTRSTFLCVCEIKSFNLLIFVGIGNALSYCCHGFQYFPTIFIEFPFILSHHLRFPTGFLLKPFIDLVVGGTWINFLFAYLFMCMYLYIRECLLLNGQSRNKGWLMILQSVYIWMCSLCLFI
jgi:hypothetical protein